jgi:hypothetical protein
MVMAFFLSFLRQKEFLLFLEIMKLVGVGLVGWHGGFPFWLIEEGQIRLVKTVRIERSRDAVQSRTTSRCLDYARHERLSVWEYRVLGSAR